MAEPLHCFSSQLTTKLLEFGHAQGAEVNWLNKEEKTDNYLGHAVKVVAIELGSSLLCLSAAIETVVYSVLFVIDAPVLFVDPDSALAQSMHHKASIVESSFLTMKWNLRTIFNFSFFRTNVATQENFSSPFLAQESDKISEFLATTVSVALVAAALVCASYSILPLAFLVLGASICIEKGEFFSCLATRLSIYTLTLVVRTVWEYLKEVLSLEAVCCFIQGYSLTVNPNSDELDDNPPYSEEPEVQNNAGLLGPIEKLRLTDLCQAIYNMLWSNRPSNISWNTWLQDSLSNDSVIPYNQIDLQKNRALQSLLFSGQTKNAIAFIQEYNTITTSPQLTQYLLIKELQQMPLSHRAKAIELAGHEGIA